MTSLGERLDRRIRSEGPLSLSQFMALALHDPEAGYYARRQPIGREGDYVTAPEMSQVFGELIGLWCAELWTRMGRPDPVMLAELGPGRGVMAEDLLRAAAAVPDFRRALRLHLVEASPVLRAEQERRLGRAEPRCVASLDELPPGPLLVVANEFLDALPIRQLRRGREGWSERLVGLDADGRRVFVGGPASRAAGLLVPERLRRTAEPGSVVEICPAALALAALLGERFAREPGAALFIDYGYGEARAGATLRAFRRHRAVSALDEPGEADLSAAVDFAAFAEAARAAGAAVSGPVTQRQFLLALGVEMRLAALAKGASPEVRARLEAGVARLIDPGDMGVLFQAIAVSSPSLAPAAGFEGGGAGR
ncbi:MAG TPA: SAM-dependent methyltransferase [Stellaceae bacterium]|nr:SAM-dependent methyltransferase [Stellaceae bacterium]